MSYHCYSCYIAQAFHNGRKSKRETLIPIEYHQSNDLYYAYTEGRYSGIDIMRDPRFMETCKLARTIIIKSIMKYPPRFNSYSDRRYHSFLMDQDRITV